MRQNLASCAVWSVVSVALAIMPSACSTSSSSFNPAASYLKSPGHLAASAAVSSSNKVLRSYIAPEAKQQDLLYVTTLDRAEVYVYTYPKGQIVGTLTGFEATTGLCVDRAGDIFVADAAKADITEYAHGEAVPIATYHDTKYGQPYDCTIDPVTNNLAVTNYIDDAVGTGDVVVFHQRRPPYSIYADANIGLLGYCSYDGHGNLFIDSLNRGFVSEIAQLRRGASAFSVVPFPQQRQESPDLAWDGRWLTVAGPSSIYRLRIDQAGAHIVGTTLLNHTDLLEGYTVAKQSGPHAFDRLVGANYNGANVSIWKYPEGGFPIRSISSIGDTHSAAVSDVPLKHQR